MGAARPQPPLSHMWLPAQQTRSSMPVRCLLPFMQVDAVINRFITNDSSPNFPQVADSSVVFLDKLDVVSDYPTGLRHSILREHRR